MQTEQVSNPAKTGVYYAVRGEHLELANYPERAWFYYRLAWLAGRRDGASDDWLYGIARRYWILSERLGYTEPITQASESGPTQ